ncbi:serine-rich adhesin for platelets-like [Watersipora subatra]|uniref:serine-rich adhesin for platelets-like n=1 Tax=Watersipora subatra TaxID=2589382 RepID=UPI00355B9E98
MAKGVISRPPAGKGQAEPTTELVPEKLAYYLDKAAKTTSTAASKKPTDIPSGSSSLSVTGTVSHAKQTFNHGQLTTSANQKPAKAQTISHSALFQNTQIHNPNASGSGSTPSATTSSIAQLGSVSTSMNNNSSKSLKATNVAPTTSTMSKPFKAQTKKIHVSTQSSLLTPRLLNSQNTSRQTLNTHGISIPTRTSVKHTDKTSPAIAAVITTYSKHVGGTSLLTAGATANSVSRNLSPTAANNGTMKSSLWTTLPKNAALSKFKTPGNNLQTNNFLMKKPKNNTTYKHKLSTNSRAFQQTISGVFNPAGHSTKNAYAITNKQTPSTTSSHLTNPKKISKNVQGVGYTPAANHSHKQSTLNATMDRNSGVVHASSATVTAIHDFSTNRLSNPNKNTSSKLSGNTQTNQKNGGKSRTEKTTISNGTIIKHLTKQFTTKDKLNGGNMKKSKGTPSNTPFSNTDTKAPNGLHETGNGVGKTTTSGVTNVNGIPPATADLSKSASSLSAMLTHPNSPNTQYVSMMSNGKQTTFDRSNKAVMSATSNVKGTASGGSRSPKASAPSATVINQINHKNSTTVLRKTSSTQGSGTTKYHFIATARHGTGRNMNNMLSKIKGSTTENFRHTGMVTSDKSNIRQTTDTDKTVQNGPNWSSQGQSGAGKYQSGSTIAPKSAFTKAIETQTQKPYTVSPNDWHFNRNGKTMAWSNTTPQGYLRSTHSGIQKVDDIRGTGTKNKVSNTFSTKQKLLDRSSTTKSIGVSNTALLTAISPNKNISGKISSVSTNAFKTVSSRNSVNQVTSNRTPSKSQNVTPKVSFTDSATKNKQTGFVPTKFVQNGKGTVMETNSARSKSNLKTTPSSPPKNTNGSFASSVSKNGQQKTKMSTSSNGYINNSQYSTNSQSLRKSEHTTIYGQGRSANTFNKTTELGTPCSFLSSFSGLTSSWAGGTLSPTIYGNNKSDSGKTKDGGSVATAKSTRKLSNHVATKTLNTPSPKNSLGVFSGTATSEAISRSLRQTTTSNDKPAGFNHSNPPPSNNMSNVITPFVTPANTIVGNGKISNAQSVGPTLSNHQTNTANIFSKFASNATWISNGPISVTHSNIHIATDKFGRQIGGTKMSSSASQKRNRNSTTNKNDQTTTRPVNGNQFTTASLSHLNTGANSKTSQVNSWTTVQGVYSHSGVTSHKTVQGNSNNVKVSNGSKGTSSIGITASKSKAGTKSTVYKSAQTLNQHTTGKHSLQRVSSHSNSSNKVHSPTVKASKSTILASTSMQGQGQNGANVPKTSSNGITSSSTKVVQGQAASSRKPTSGNKITLGGPLANAQLTQLSQTLLNSKTPTTLSGMASIRSASTSTVPQASGATSNNHVAGSHGLNLFTKIYATTDQAPTRIPTWRSPPNVANLKTKSDLLKITNKNGAKSSGFKGYTTVHIIGNTFGSTQSLGKATKSTTAAITHGKGANSSLSIQKITWTSNSIHSKTRTALSHQGNNNSQKDTTTNSAGVTPGNNSNKPIKRVAGTSVSNAPALSSVASVGGFMRKAGSSVKSIYVKESTTDKSISKVWTPTSSGSSKSRTVDIRGTMKQGAGVGQTIKSQNILSPPNAATATISKNGIGASSFPNSKVINGNNKPGLNGQNTPKPITQLGNNLGGKTAKTGRPRLCSTWLGPLSLAGPTQLGFWLDSALAWLDLAAELRLKEICTNGVISLNRSYNKYSSKRFPRSDSNSPVAPLISPFWADVDLSTNGSLWFRETSEPSLLYNVSLQVQEVYHSAATHSYNATWMLVATWKNVLPFIESKDHFKPLPNTFQAVIVSNGSYFVTIFNYEQINWIAGTTSNQKPAQVPPLLSETSFTCFNPNFMKNTFLVKVNAYLWSFNKVGFDAGDNTNYYSIPGSRTAAIINITSESNVGIPGRMVFLLGTAGTTSNITAPGR